MPIFIRVLRGEGEESPRDLEISKTTILIGRGSTEDVCLRNDSVSRRHCVLEQRDGEWILIDEGSKNGTLVNGSHVKGSRPLRHGDAVEIGEVVLLIGIDKPPEAARRAVSQEKQAGKLATIINSTLLAIALAACLIVTGFVWNARSYVRQITRPLPIDLGEKKDLDVFDGADRRHVLFALPTPKDFAQESENGIYYPVPEWNLGDVWTAAVEGKQPRIFDGLDIDLHGGNQIALSSYFYVTKQYWAHDANDPYGRIHFDIEGWADLGPRNGIEQAPIVRMNEFPHYLRMMRIHPSDIKPCDVPGLEGGQVASFTYTQTLDPRTGHPLQYPFFRRVLAGKILPKLLPREVVFEGRCFSFFHQGCRYVAVVRGSRSLLARFPGGIDALANAFFRTFQFEGIKEREAVDPAQFRDKLRQKSVFMEVFQKKISVLPDLRYRDLMDIRSLLLAMQAMPEALEEEDAYRRAYFELRNRAQSELEFGLQKIYEGRLLDSAPEGVEQLERIRTFLGDYPPPTMKPGQFGYPEWARFYESAVQRKPYIRRR